MTTNEAMYYSVEVRVCIRSTPDIVARIEIVLHYRQINSVNCECSIECVSVCVCVYSHSVLSLSLIPLSLACDAKAFIASNFALLFIVITKQLTNI